MTEETFEIICSDCDNRVEVVSPSTLTCNSCGCGTHRFAKEMEIKCFYGHIQIGREAKPCKECINTERTMYRTFKRAKGSDPEITGDPKPRTRTKPKTTGIKRRKGGGWTKGKKKKKK